MRWSQGSRFRIDTYDLQIAFVEPVAVGTEFTVHVDYSAQPTPVCTFEHAMGYPATDTHLWTQGEAHEARHWFPCFDYPNETIDDRGYMSRSQGDDCPQQTAAEWMSASMNKV